MNTFKSSRWYYIGIAVGAASILFGIIMLISTAGDHYSSMIDSYVKYGADFYTDVYGATARAANVLRFQYEMLRASICGGFILAGATEICAFSALIAKQKQAAGSKPASVVEVHSAETTESQTAEG